MNKRNLILLVGLLLLAQLVSARSGSDFGRDKNKYKKTLRSEKCSREIEKLKLCAENPEAVNSGEEVRIKLLWVNTSDADRRIGRGSVGYSVTVKDEKGRKMIPVYEQRLKEWQKQRKKSGEKEKGGLFRFFGGSDRGLYVEAGGTEKDRINLADPLHDYELSAKGNFLSLNERTLRSYDYDLSAKGKYYVRIEKTVPSRKGKNPIKFVIEKIEIQVN